MIVIIFKRVSARLHRGRQGGVIMKKLDESNAPSIFIPTKKPQITESAVTGREVLEVEGIFGKVDARNENKK